MPLTLDPTGISTAISAGSDLIESIIQRAWPDKSKEEAAQLAAQVQMINSQLEINKTEASSSSVFVAGWRPFIGWVCGSGCAWNWIGLPMAKFGLAIFGVTVALSSADLSEMMPLLLGMLGLGSLRTYEKVAGVARNNMKG